MLLHRVQLTEVVQLVMLQLRKGIHRVDKIQQCVSRRSNNVCKRAHKGSNKLALNSRPVHSNKLAHKCNSNICNPVLLAVAVVVQQEEEVTKAVVVVAVIVDNR